ncbi:glutathione transferase [Trichoderma evansii]
MSSPSLQSGGQQFNDDIYYLYYWPGLPGRGEFIRLVLEQANVKYVDVALQEDGMKQCMDLVRPSETWSAGDTTNLAVCYLPALRHKTLLISQTSNILQYIGMQMGLAGDLDADPGTAYRVSSMAMNVVDGLCTEAHDTHHPIANALFYEEQREEAIRRSKEYVFNRLPKFIGFFERALRGMASGQGPWLCGGQLTYADLTLFQGIDGTKHMFPRAMSDMETSGKYDKVFRLYEAVRQLPRIAAYLRSDRRQKYGVGIWRFYQELDHRPLELTDQRVYQGPYDYYKN